VDAGQPAGAHHVVEGHAMSNLILTRKSLIVPAGPSTNPHGLSQVRGPERSPILVNPYRLGTPVPGEGYGFRPTDLPNLKVWWRADDGIALSGSDITSIADLSGNANHGTPGANKATLVTGVTGSLPAMRWGSATSRPYTLPTNCMSGVTAASIYLALNITNDPSFLGDQGGLMDWSTQDGNSSHFPFTDSVVYDGFGSLTRFTTGNPTLSLAAWRRIIIKAEASGYQMWIDGTSHFSNTTACGSNWIATPQVGQSKGATIRFVGDLLEMIVYADVKNSTDRGLLDTYLADRISGTWFAS
jgi:hypothetical protein